MPMARQPLILAICPTTEPVAPAAPETTTVSPRRPAYLEEAEIGGHSGQPERAHRQLEGHAGRQLVELALGVHHDIILPADKAGHDVADREIGMVRRFDAARADRADDLADLTAGR